MPLKMAGDKQPMVGKNFRCFGFCCFYPTDAQENAPTAILLTESGVMRSYDFLVGYPDSKLGA